MVVLLQAGLLAIKDMYFPSTISKINSITRSSKSYDFGKDDPNWQVQDFCSPSQYSTPLFERSSQTFTSSLIDNLSESISHHKSHGYVQLLDLAVMRFICLHRT